MTDWQIEFESEGVDGMTVVEPTESPVDGMTVVDPTEDDTQPISIVTEGVLSGTPIQLPLPTMEGFVDPSRPISPVDQKYRLWIDSVCIGDDLKGNQVFIDTPTLIDQRGQEVVRFTGERESAYVLANYVLSLIEADQARRAGQ